MQNFYLVMETKKGSDSDKYSLAKELLINWTRPTQIWNWNKCLS